MHILQRSSPNFDSRDGQTVDMLVLHYTGMKTAAEALERLCDPTAKVSAHYVVDEDGSIIQLVDEASRAWHAGVSSWRGHTNINQRSIGIEIVNPGHVFGYRTFPAAQMKSVVELCTQILARHAIPARNVVGHSDVAPARKQDPGELFDWALLAKHGIGLWPKASVGFYNRFYRKWFSSITASFLMDGFGGIPDGTFITRDLLENRTKPMFPCDEIQKLLSDFGYNCEVTGNMDVQTRNTITAFQRHYLPHQITSAWNRHSHATLVALLKMV
jgi:N-acetylmuramoyl-L-alanine amidase